MENSETKNPLKLKDVVEGVKAAIRYLRSKWRIIILLGVTGGALGFTYACFKKPVYTAMLTFALEEKNGSMGSYANIASQFGLDLGGGNGNGGAFVGENLLELLRSRFLVEKTLLTTVEINGKKDLLVNRYMQFMELTKAAEKNTDIIPVTYTPDQPRSRFSIQQDSLLFGIYENIIKTDLLVRKVDKKLNIVIVEYHSIDELFAKCFTTELVRNASEFYVETKTKKTRANVVLLQERVDSVKAVLDQRIYGAATSQDRNQNPAKAQSKVPLLKQQMEVQILTTMYGELLKNLELSKFTLMREEPLVQIIDKPILPLEKKKAGKIKWTVIGFVLFGFLTGSYLMVRRTYRKLMDIESTVAA
jgi:uncharacterized protein involved in exopolysaccharide biosynthesis